MKEATGRGSPRLPRSVLPSRYDVRLKPDLDACTFAGKLAVELSVVDPVDEIILNASADIKAGDIYLLCADSDETLVPSTDYIADDELLVLTFKSKLTAGKATLSLDYTGVLNDQMKGFYRSTYNVDGETRNMAVTQFEPADARRCFPCWDEPSFKAVFKLTVEAPKDRVVLSNMPVVATEDVSGERKIVEFDETPLMSTYLVAVVVGEFKYLEGTTKDGVKVRVYTLPSKVEMGKFALDVALKCLPYYSEYFETPYPLPKLDMVAIPDFAAGAMENYGLVTYREAALLFDDKHSAAANKQRVAVVVAHELAHQWFGNLVTMEWWTHLWLNEGFATWVSYLAADHLFPDWKVWTQFNQLTASAFRLDGLSESHAIEVEVRHVREIDEIFDAISYEKGASIIRMLQNYLGADVFQKGLASYIKKFAYGNAMTEDLWDSLSEASGQPVREMMNTWTKQKGYPVVSVKRAGDVLEINQAQFLSSGLPGNGEWVLPLTLCVNSYDAHKSVLVKGSSSIPVREIAGVGQEQWVKVNVGQTGFYRVNYDEKLAESLRTVIGTLHPADRYGILDDNYALCKACHQPLRILLTLMQVYSSETDPTVLTFLITVARAVCKILKDAIPSMIQDVKDFFSRLLLASARRIGWDNVPGEGDLISMLRGDLMSALVAFDHEETVVEAKARFQDYLAERDTPRLPADIRKAAYQAVMKDVTASDKSGYESLLEIYRGTDMSQERTRILFSIASSRDKDMVREALDLLFTPEVRSQDAMYVLSGVTSECRETRWAWLKDNWDTIKSKWGEGFLITRFVSITTSGFSSQERADEIQEFFSKHGIVAIERTVKQSVERVRINARWVEFIREEAGLKELIGELAQG